MTTNDLLRTVTATIGLLGMLILGSHAARADLVTYFDFDSDVTAGGTVVGALATPFDGTLVRTASVHDGYLDLRGNSTASNDTGDYMVLPDIRSGHFAGSEATLSMWIKKEVASQSGLRGGLVALGTGLASHYGWSGDLSYYSMFQTGRHSGNLRPQAEVDRTEWHHFAVTTEPGSGNYKIYQNGVEVPASGASPGTFIVNPIPWIGRSNEDAGSGNDYFHYGLLDEVAIFDHALSGTEVAGLADSSLTVRQVAGTTINPGGEGVIGTESIAIRTGNLAPDGTATQSSDYSATKWGAEVAIDGLKHPTDGDFAHTKANQSEQWWQVDLGVTCEVDEVNIFNRAAGFANNLLGTSAGGGFRASILDSTGAVVGYRDYDHTDSFTYPFVIDQFDVGGTLEDVVIGQTVRLEKLLPLETGNSGYYATWNLSEVEVDAVYPAHFTLGQYDTLAIELDAGAGTGDLLDVGGTLTLDGWLEVSLIGGTPEHGDTFDILDWGTLVGTFDEIHLPTLPARMHWITSNLYVDGTITAFIPEPATWLLALLGLAGFGLTTARRRRP